MFHCLIGKDASHLSEQLNGLAPGSIVLSIYAINQKHFAWVKLPVEKTETPAPKAKSKGPK